MAKINFNIVQGGLGRVSADTDKTALLCVSVPTAELDALPEHWQTDAGDFKVALKKLNRVEDLATVDLPTTDFTTAPTTEIARLQYKTLNAVREYFRLSPEGTLYLSFVRGGASSDVYGSLFELKGDCRIVGMIGQTADTHVDLHNQLEKLFVDFNISTRAVFGNGAALTSQVASDRVMFENMRDYTDGTLSKKLLDAGVEPTSVGTVLGQLSRVSVHQKISRRARPINSGGAFEVYTELDALEAATAALNDDGSVLNATSQIGISGTFLNSSRTLAPIESDYAIVNHGRVIDKAIYLINKAMAVELDSPLYLDPYTGKMSKETVARLQQVGRDAISDGMIKNKAGDEIEVSIDTATGMLPAGTIFIDPDQNVLDAEEIVTEISIVPPGAAKAITNNIGLKASLN